MERDWRRPMQHGDMEWSSRVRWAGIWVYWTILHRNAEMLFIFLLFFPDHAPFFALVSRT